jgi:predicted metalloprotease
MPLKVGGGAGLVLLLIVLVLGGDPGALLEMGQGGGPMETAQPGPEPSADDPEAQFASAMLASTEDVWGPVFEQAGARYREPTLVLFTDAVQSACGYNTSATGPFYCPGDQNLYIDLGFFRQLAQMGGAGDFAAAYVIGHEVGHHVQQLTGISDRVRQAQSRARSQADVNGLQVLMELQADCLAGVWANHANRTRDILEPGDVDEGLRAAEAIGDDRLLRNAGRRVAPESFTHGTSAQRREWLSRGLRTGDWDACDTFAAEGIRL